MGRSQPMEIFRGGPPYPRRAALAPSGVAVAIGNFDGVHRGHLTVIAAARRRAEALGARLGALTFEPHPRQVFQPDLPPFRLTPEPLKARKLAAAGVELMAVLPFDKALSSLSPADFAERILVDGLGARSVAVGRDFRFGAKRAGDVGVLTALGAELGFSVDVVDQVGDDGEEEAPFSSTAARAALQAGDPVEAARILGDWHRIEGVVEQGDQRGRTLGYPTANLAMDGVLHPAYGVYAVRAELLDGPHRGVYDGVAALGLRPTFDKTIANFETFLFDFSGDLYGAALSVSLIKFLRPELKFDSIEALIARMDQDSQEARAALAAAAAPWRGA